MALLLLQRADTLRDKMAAEGGATAAVASADGGANTASSSGELLQMLLQATPLERRNLLGERLFPAAKAHLAASGTYPVHRAGKITGMLLEMEVSEIMGLLEDSDALAQRVGEAVRVLQDADMPVRARGGDRHAAAPKAAASDLHARQGAAQAHTDVSVHSELASNPPAPSSSTVPATAAAAADESDARLVAHLAMRFGGAVGTAGHPVVAAHVAVRYRSATGAAGAKAPRAPATGAVLAPRAVPDASLAFEAAITVAGAGPVDSAFAVSAAGVGSGGAAGSGAAGGGAAAGPAAALLSQLASATPEQRLNLIGERLYGLVAERRTGMTGRITDVLLEGKDSWELLRLLDKPRELDERIRDARAALLAAPGAAPGAAHGAVVSEAGASKTASAAAFAPAAAAAATGSPSPSAQPETAVVASGGPAGITAPGGVADAPSASGKLPGRGALGFKLCNDLAPPTARPDGEVDGEVHGMPASSREDAAAAAAHGGAGAEDVAGGAGAAATQGPLSALDDAARASDAATTDAKQKSVTAQHAAARLGKPPMDGDTANGLLNTALRGCSGGASLAAALTRFVDENADAASSATILQLSCFRANDDDCAFDLTSAIKRLARLQQLILPGFEGPCDVVGAFSCWLAASLPHVPLLRRLDLDHLDMRGLGSVGLISQLPCLPLLEFLSLRHTGLPDAHVKQLAGVLPHLPQLQHVRLGSSICYYSDIWDKHVFPRASDATARELVRVMPLLSKIKTIDLADGHSITAELAAQLKAAAVSAGVSVLL